MSMTEQEALSKMVAPGTPRPGKYRQGVIQIWVTRACDKSCFACTQGSNLRGNPGMITPEQFEQAVLSLKGYWGVVGVFGGNPAMHPEFPRLCEILRQHIPYEQRGLWCNNPLGHGKVMRQTFNPAVSNLNVHLDAAAYREFKRDWPECGPVGLKQDSRHSPVFVAMKDIIQDEGQRWELISNCDINKHWSAMIGVFRGEVRAWFCEIAGAQAMLHQHEPDYPDTGRLLTYPCDGKAVRTSDHSNTEWHTFSFCPVCRGNGSAHEVSWWQLPMYSFAHQVRKHCHECSVPLRGYGELAQAETGTEQTSAAHADVFHSKVKGRPVQIVDRLDDLRPQSLGSVVRYLQNANR